MFQSLSTSLVFLIFLLAFNMASCNDGTSQTESVTEAVTEPTTELFNVTARGNLTLEECSNPTELWKQNCCSSNLGVDSALTKCVMLHRKKMPKEKEPNLSKRIQYYSCLVECIYKAKKYIGKKLNTLNMKQIKADANKLHHDDPRERDYMIGMYKNCEKQTAKDFADIEDKAGSLFYKACKPYYMFVFVCVLQYGKISCPYFKWNDSKGTMQVCEDMKEKCEQMHQ